MLRKSHCALRSPHNKGSKNRRPDLLFWPCCVFTPLSLQHCELRDCFHQRSAGLLWRLALPWEDSLRDVAATRSAARPLITVSWPTVCTQWSWSLCVGLFVYSMKINQKIWYNNIIFFSLGEVFHAGGVVLSTNLVKDEISQPIQLGLPWFPTYFGFSPGLCLLFCINFCIDYHKIHTIHVILRINVIICELNK